MFKASIIVEAETEEDLQAILSDTLADIRAMDECRNVYVVNDQCSMKRRKGD